MVLKTKENQKEDQKEKQKEKQKKPFRLTNTVYHVFWVLLLVSVVVGTAVHTERHSYYEAEKKKLAIKLEQQAAVNESLRKELEYYGTDAYVERVAGERLGLVKPDEIVFYNSEE